MSRMELYSPEGLRVDGRRWNELRNFNCSINTHPSSSDGSSYVEMGNSKVICTIRGPMEPASRAQLSSTAATLSISLNVATFSTVERKKRSKTDRRTAEMNTILQRTFEQAIMVKNYPRTVIEVTVNVLAQDGGLLASCANAITLALIDAGISMYDYISSVTAGLYDVSPLLDLNTLEENDLSFLTIGVVGKTEKISMLLLENRMPLDNLEKVLSIAIAGSHRVRDLMDEQVRRHGNQRLAKLENK